MSLILRESWLQACIEGIRNGLFKQCGYDVPKVKVSVGFPVGSSAVIGQIYYGVCSADGECQIFVTPKIDDAKEALAIVVHELVHAVAGPTAGHGAAFREIALKVGLEGKMTCTVAGQRLMTYFERLIDIAGPYPHVALLVPGQRKQEPGIVIPKSIIPEHSGPKKQTARMIKMTCNACGYIARTAKANIEKHGPTICPCNNASMSLS